MNSRHGYLLRGTQEVALLFVVVKIAKSSFKLTKVDDENDKFQNAILPISEQLISLNVEYNSNFRLLDEKFQGIATDIVRPNQKKIVHLNDIHEFLDSILNDRLSTESVHQPEKKEANSEDVEFPSSDFKEKYRTFSKDATDINYAKIPHSKHVISNLFDLALERMQLQSNMTDIVAKSLDQSHNELESTMMPVTANNSSVDLATSLAAIGLYGAGRALLDKYGVKVEKIPEKIVKSNLIWRNLRTIPLLAVFGVTYVILDTSKSTMKTIQQAVQKEKEKSIVKPLSSLQALTGQECADLISTPYDSARHTSVLENMSSPNGRDLELNLNLKDNVHNSTKAAMKWSDIGTADPMPKERLFKEIVLQPIQNEILFRGILLRSLLTCMHPLQAVWFMLLADILCQDEEEEEDNSKVVKKATFANIVNEVLGDMNFISTIFSTVLYFSSGNIVFPILFQVSIHVFKAVKEFMLVDNTQYLRENMYISQKANDFLANYIVAKYLITFDKQKKQNDLVITPEITALAKEMMNKFTTSTHSEDVMCIKDVVDMMTAFEWPGIQNKRSPFDYHTSCWMDSMNYIREKEIYRKVCEKTDGKLTLSQLEIMIALTIRELEKVKKMLAGANEMQINLAKRIIPRIYPILSPQLSVSEIISRITHVDNMNNEQFMDLIQAYYDAYLLATERHILAFKPHIDASFEQKLMGRRPSSVEFQEKLNKLKAMTDVANERWKVSYLHTNYGLTPRRFEILCNQFGVRDSAVKTLRDDWEAYFKSPQYSARLNELLNKDSHGNAIQVYDE